MEFKVIIAGGRSFGNVRLHGKVQAEQDFLTLCSTMDTLLVEKTKTYTITIISGGAQGADTLGERYAQLKGFKLIRMKADWKKHGKPAGFIRNGDMLNIADGVVCFWDRKSKGTLHMINITNKDNKPLRIINY